MDFRRGTSVYYNKRRRKIVVSGSRKRELQDLIKCIRMRQRYHVLSGNWQRVIDLDIRLHVLRSELYGVGYCGQ